MSVPHGAIHASNRGGGKDGRGNHTPLGPLLRQINMTLLVPNRKAKHRAQATNFVLKYEIAYIKNRWYAYVKPMIKNKLKIKK